MKVLLITLVIVVTFSVLGCYLDSSNDGGLILTINDLSNSKGITLIPPLDTAIASYRITGIGPGGTSFERSDITATTVIIDALAIGSWQITVEALNVDDEIIGAGSTSVAIVAGDSTVATVIVVPLSGTGVLQLIVSWPVGLISDPTVEGTLTLLGGSSTDILFTVAGNSATYQNNALDAGYYALTLRYYEGSIKVGGTALAVRILAGQTTAGTIVLDSSQIDPGSLVVTIIPDMQNPLEISLQGNLPALIPGTDMTVTATLTPTVPSPSYQWYLGGSPVLDATDQTFIVGSALAEGNYQVDLIVASGNVFSSAGFSFTVSQYARTPIFYVHGYAMNSLFFGPMRAYLQQVAGYPPELVGSIDLLPNTGANVAAAETQLQPSIEQFLININDYLTSNQPAVPAKTKVDIIAHSMGSLSSRWYAARVRPDQVGKWISLAGVNHGSSVADFAGEITPGEQDMYPAFAPNETESYIQYQLNGEPLAPDVDETPYGQGIDTAGVTVVPPDSVRSILYATIAADPPDRWVQPDSSVQLDGTGGIVIDIPPALPVTILSDGNFQMSNGIGHDDMLADPDTMELVRLILYTMN